jgi:hypothetical protein
MWLQAQCSAVPWCRVNWRDWWEVEYRWSGVRWVKVKFLRINVPFTLGRTYTEDTRLYCDFHLCISWTVVVVACTVVVLTCFVMCGFLMCVSFGNMYTCIYCVLYCLYCVFVLFRLGMFSYLFCLYCQWKKTQLHNSNNNNSAVRRRWRKNIVER